MLRLGPAVPLAKLTDRWTSGSELSLDFFLDGENLPIRGRNGEEVFDSVAGDGSDETLPCLPLAGLGEVSLFSFALAAPPVAIEAAAASAEVTDAPIAPVLGAAAASSFFFFRHNILGRFLFPRFFFFFFDFVPTTSASLPPPPPGSRLPSLHPECSFCSFSLGCSCR